MKGKFLICDSAASNWGKTSTLTELIGLMKEKNYLCDLCEECGQDICAVFKYADDVTVAVCSAGDPGSCAAEKLIEYSQKGVDIIVCAARTHGSTVDNVMKLEEYERIWFRNFSGEPSTVQILNETSAEAILSLIDKLSK